MTKNNSRKIILLVLLISSFQCRIIHVYAWEVDKTSRVTNIVDGDTFDIATGERIRFADIDTPEPDQEGGPWSSSKKPSQDNKMSWLFQSD